MDAKQGKAKQGPRPTSKKSNDGASGSGKRVKGTSAASKKRKRPATKKYLSDGDSSDSSDLFASAQKKAMRKHYLLSSSDGEFSDPDMELAMKSIDLSRLKTSVTTTKKAPETGIGRVSLTSRFGANANRSTRPTMGATAPAPGPSRSQASTTATKSRAGPSGVRSTKEDWSEIEIPRAPPTPDSLSSLSSLAFQPIGSTPNLPESDASPAKDVIGTVPQPLHQLSQDQEMDELDSDSPGPAESSGVATSGMVPETTLKDDGLILSTPVEQATGALPDQLAMSETTVHPTNPSQDVGTKVARPEPSSSTQNLLDPEAGEGDELSSSVSIDNLLLDIPLGALDAAERAELLF